MNFCTHLFYLLTLMHHNDLVAVLDRRETVSDADCNTTVKLEHAVEGLLHFLFVH